MMVGTLNEDFAVESLAGDIFQLGNVSYRILRVEAGKVRVEDAAGQAPTIPFWLGEAPARTDELSGAVSALRSEIDHALDSVDRAAVEACVAMIADRHQLGAVASRQLVEYLAAAKATLNSLPTRGQLVIERFFDEAGGMQLVIHAPYGARVNRAFGLALRKRFCQTFNFELQAAATEDAIVLSLGETHSFALEEVAKYLHSNTVEAVLTQAVLDAPLFMTRWRWNATISLAIRTSRAGKKTPPPLLRMAAEDLVSVIFPDQLACLENISGPREIPDHPLVRQTLHDCLHEAMDVDGLIALLRGIESGSIHVLTRDLPQPSMLAMEILNARPYAYLDDAPLEERRTQAVAARRWLDPQTASQYGRLDPAAIAQLREEAWPDPDNADELHDALMLFGALPEAEGLGKGPVDRAGWQPHFESLVESRRATRLTEGDRRFWVAAEQLPLATAVFPHASMEPAILAPLSHARELTREESVRELLRGRLQAVGPETASSLDTTLALPAGSAQAALLALEAEGFVMRGNFTTGPAEQAAGAEPEWCERRLLARISRYTIRTLREQIQPVASADFMRFLLEWQGVTREPKGEGPQSTAAVIEQLEGFEIPAIAWERDVLPARLRAYDPAWLDTLCLSGRVVWARLDVPRGSVAGPVRATPIALLSRAHLPLWRECSQRQRNDVQLSSPAQAIAGHLAAQGASFFDELARGSGLLQSQAEAALGELVAAGMASADSFGGLRALLLPMETKRRLATRGRRVALFGLEEAGRWTLLRPASSANADTAEDPDRVEQIAWRLLQRYGVVFRRVLAREAPWLPPWHALLRVLRRLEAQGHVRGGRFVAGVSGEQYALPDAVTALRAVRQRAPDGALVSLSAADPLNLLGLVTPGRRLAALAGNRFVLRDGVPIAMHAAGELEYLVDLPVPEQWAVRNALLRRAASTAAAQRA
jgi:ATP-dependent Lhr-like helicase